MKKNLLKNFLLFTCLLFMQQIAFPQWCVPTTAIPYSPNMPGITHVTLNTIDRASADCENYPNNSYVNTGLSTTLVIGDVYEISITFTVDASICPDMNIRVWIDLDDNGSFYDIGETVISADHVSPGTYTNTFTLPSYSVPSTTRMRVTAKMSSLGGHTLPTPCDDPADPAGYHGEFEDYDIVIQSGTEAIPQIQAGNITASIFPDPAKDDVSFLYFLNQDAPVSVKIFSASGELVSIPLNTELQTSGNHVCQFRTKDAGVLPGIYFIQITAGDATEVKKLMVIQ